MVCYLILLYCFMLNFTSLQRIAWHFIVLYHVPWYCIVFDIIAVYCMSPHCILLYGMVLYFIWSYCTVSHRHVPLLIIVMILMVILMIMRKNLPNIMIFQQKCTNFKDFYLVKKRPKKGHGSSFVRYRLCLEYWVRLRIDKKNDRGWLSRASKQQIIV